MNLNCSKYEAIDMIMTWQMHFSVFSKTKHANSVNLTEQH